MKIIYTPDYDRMSRRAAGILAAQVVLKPNCVLGLATGSTPLGIYKQLIEWNKAGDLDFSDVRTVNLDEYVGLPASDEHSYAYFMNDNLFSHINIDQANTHLPDGTNPDHGGECARYDEVVRSMGGIDVQLLGIGHNGHIGFNEPAEFFAGGTNCVALTQSTIEANKRFFDKPGDVPTHAYTMGIGTIMNARKILMVINGAAKADILCRMATGPIEPGVPASILQIHPDVTVVADAEALATLLAKAPERVSGRPV